MKILDLVQGSDEWLKARLDYLCASEAPAMMGDSKFMTRNQLLDLKAGWLDNPVSSFTKRLYQKGHEHEAQAREIIEVEMCEDIKPLVAISNIYGLNLLASFDGVVIDGNDKISLLWEHKSWNKILAENVRNNTLEPLHYWQLEHQMLVAGEKEIIFTCSDGTTENKVSMTYTSTPERMSKLINGWRLFLNDLDTHEIGAKQEVVIAQEQESFPIIQCRVEGSKVISNLGSYIPIIKMLAQEQMNLVLDSDQDFADKEAFNKKVKIARASLKGQAQDIEKNFESLAIFNTEAKEIDRVFQMMQSHGERQVKESKAAKKRQIISCASGQLGEFLLNLIQSIERYHLTVDYDFDGVIKGKKSFGKMEDAIDSELARCKILALQIHDKVLKNINTFNDIALDYKFLFNDKQNLLEKDNEDFENLVKSRIMKHEIEIERQRKEEKERIELEAQIKADREVKRKIAAEEKRIREEERAKVHAENKKLEEKREAERLATKQLKEADEQALQAIEQEEPQPIKETKPKVVKKEPNNIPDKLLSELEKWCDSVYVSLDSCEELEKILQKYF